MTNRGNMYDDAGSQHGDSLHPHGDDDGMSSAEHEHGTVSTVYLEVVDVDIVAGSVGYCLQASAFVALRDYGCRSCGGPLGKAGVVVCIPRQ
eukprot:7233-Eustigmatos_ZCMA.PRE.1